MQQVMEVASSKSLDASQIHENHSFIAAPETLGDVGCSLEWKNGVVVKSQHRGPPDDP
jgi:hypothetical protein